MNWMLMIFIVNVTVYFVIINIVSKMSSSVFLFYITTPTTADAVGPSDH